MPIVKEIPNPIPKSTCETHGEYEHKFIPWIDDDYMESMHCQKCINENAEKDRKKQQEDDQDQVLRIKERQQIEAGISLRYHKVKFSDFDQSTKAKKQAYSDCRSFAENVYRGEQKSSMIITGKVGTGKTMICQAMVNGLVEHKRCKMVKLIDMMREIKDTWRRDSEISEVELLKKYTTYDLLILDEVGIQFGSETESMFVFDVIDGRYQNVLPTVIISNLNIERVKEKLGDRVIDRLRDGGGKVLAFTWESGRK